jgi:hypothetical protein
MKSITLFLFCLLLAASAQTQVSKTLNVEAGQLASVLTTNELNTITDLLLTGTMDARDFRTIRDRMPELKKLNLHEVTIADYTGRDGTVSYSNNSYMENAIPQQAFQNKIKLESVILPKGTTSIKDYAFRDCKNLKKLDLPASVASFGKWFLLFCDSLTSINIPTSLQIIGDNTFSGWRGLINIDIPITVNAIGNSAFSSCSNLISIQIPSSVTKLGNSVFSDCTNLSSVSLPNSLSSIGNSAFYQCSGLKFIQLPVELTSIGSRAFFGCYGLENIFIPSSVKYIGLEAFRGTKASVNVAEPNFDYSSLEGILFDKKKDTLIYCPNSITGDYSIPSTVKVIGEYAFHGCSLLENISLPLTLNIVGDNAFNNCKKLTSIDLPASVVSIGKNAFDGCSGLKLIVIPDSVTIIERNTFYGCAGLTTVVIPQAVTSIGKQAFGHCTGLTSIELPVSLNTIDSQAFWNCKGLKALAIPASVSKIGSHAFGNCTGLTSIYVYPKIPPDLYDSPNVFAGINKSTSKLNVPYGTSQLYASEYQWKDFKQIVEMTGFSLSTHSIYLFNDVDSYASVMLLSNVPWEASSDKSWLRVLPESGTDSTELIIFAEKNVSGITRSATVTVASPGMEAQTITVTQQSVIASVKYSDVTSCYGAANGSITFFDALGYQEVEYSIDGGESWRQDTSFTELSAKTYDLRIRDPNYVNKNFSLGSITLQEPRELQARVEGLNTMFCGWDYPYIQIQEPRGGSSSFEYSFDDGLTWQSDPMFYYWGWYMEQYVVVLMRDAQSPDCVVKLDEGYIYYNEPIWVDGLVTEIDLSKDQLGSIELFVHGGSGYYQINWNTGETSQKIENLTGGNYWVDVFDGYGCFYQYSFFLNSPPIANAGLNQIVSAVTKVTLDGSASSDPDNNSLTYSWIAPDGIILSSETDPQPTFSAPIVYQLTILKFVLTVNDGKTDSAPSEVSIIVCPNYEKSEEVRICEGDNYNGWHSSGLYNRTLKSLSGCDSIVVTNLVVHPSFTPTIIAKGDTLICTYNYQTYQWFDDVVPIPNATANEYIVSKSGRYHLVITDENGCKQSSEVLSLIHSDIPVIQLNKFKYSIIPNPNSGEFIFRIDSPPAGDFNLRLINPIGQVLETRLIRSPSININEQFNVNHLGKGMYFLQISTENHQNVEKIIVH